MEKPVLRCLAGGNVVNHPAPPCIVVAHKTETQKNSKDICCDYEFSFIKVLK